MHHDGCYGSRGDLTTHTRSTDRVWRPTGRKLSAQPHYPAFDGAENALPAGIDNLELHDVAIAHGGRQRLAVFGDFVHAQFGDAAITYAAVRHAGSPAPLLFAGYRAAANNAARLQIAHARGMGDKPRKVEVHAFTRVRLSECFGVELYLYRGSFSAFYGPPAAASAHPVRPLSGTVSDAKNLDRNLDCISCAGLPPPCPENYLLKSGVRSSSSLLPLGWTMTHPRRGAALSYYTMFSLAPLLLIVISIAGLTFGQDAARGQIFNQLQGLMGEDAAKAVKGQLAGRRDRGPGSGSGGTSAPTPRKPG